LRLGRWGEAISFISKGITMKKFFEDIITIWKIEELRGRIIVTLGLAFGL